MKKIKKLSMVALALAMCVLLGVTAWAANSSGVTYTADLDKNTLCVTGEAQTVTLTVKTSQKVDISSLGAVVTVPDGWKVKNIENSFLKFNTETDLEISEDGKTGGILWYEREVLNVNTDLLAVVEIEVPANAPAKNYEIVFAITDITRAVYDDEEEFQDLETWEDGASVTATVKVQEHSYTVASDTLVSQATCEAAETYKAKCANCGAVHATETISVGEAKGHAYPTTPSSYTDNEDGTHTANYVCDNDTSHTKSDAPADHTYDQEGDECVCGAVKGLKGDINLDGLVNSDDLTLLARHVGKIGTLLSGQALTNADVNGDGEVNSDDLTVHARYVGGIIKEWP